MLNKIGPRTDHCDKPLNIADHKLKLRLIFVLCQRLLRYFCIICKEFISKPYVFYFANSNSWLIVSNALDRYIGIAPAYPFLSRDDFDFF